MARTVIFGRCMDRLLGMEGSASDKSVINNTTTRPISRMNLINRLNFMNFQDKEIISIFKHKQYGKLLNRKVKPDPCSGNELHCSWAEPPGEYKPDDYVFDHLQLDDGINTITVSSDTLILDNAGFNITLPEESVELAARRIRRHLCNDIRIQMIQNGVVYKGSLKDFTPEAFGVDIEIPTRHSLELLNPDAPVTVTAMQKGEILYSGECSILLKINKRNIGKVVFRPRKNRIQRFKSQEKRFRRIKLVPSPSIVFDHPFTGQNISLQIYDISGSGFSVKEELLSSVLLPGMIIPAVEMVFSTQIKIKARVQVIYKTVEEEKKHETVIKTGFCFLDMSPLHHVQLMSLIFQAQDEHLFLGREIDSDAFWQFIFESGFIYPEKYTSLQKNKDEIKKIYQKIYSHAPVVFKHITYQEKGRILGHVAMLRIYENAWMLHHHASTVSSNRNAGIFVMGPVADYAYSAHRIPELHLDYLMVYYRPENRFPSRIFGGFRRYLNNPDGCSEDEFTYLVLTIKKEVFFDESGGLTLGESSYEDRVELENFYNRVSGGLMLKAMDILPEASLNRDVAETYKKEHLQRKIFLLSLKKKNDLVAVMLIDKTDAGINMSDLANSIKVFILKPDQLLKDELLSALDELVKRFYEGPAHALIFPPSYADKNNIGYTKKYRLWVFGLNYSDDYYNFMERLLKAGSHK